MTQIVSKISVMMSGSPIVDTGFLTKNVDDIFFIASEKIFDDLNTLQKIVYFLLTSALLAFEILKTFFYTGHINIHKKYIYDIIESIMKFLFNFLACKRAQMENKKVASIQYVDEKDKELEQKMVDVYTSMDDIKNDNNAMKQKDTELEQKMVDMYTTMDDIKNDNNAMKQKDTELEQKDKELEQKILYQRDQNECLLKKINQLEEINNGLLDKIHTLEQSKYDEELMYQKIIELIMNLKVMQTDNV